MFEKMITIYPVILDDQSNLVEQSRKLSQSGSQRPISDRGSTKYLQTDKIISC